MIPDHLLDDYRQQIKEASKHNMWLIGSYRELRRLPQYIEPEEKVIAIVSGTVTNTQFFRRGLVVATTERLLFVHDGWIFRTVQDFPYSSINSIEFNTRLFFGDFQVYGFGDDATYKGVGRNSGQKFAHTTRQLMGEYRRRNQTPQPTQQPQTGAYNPSTSHTSPVAPQTNPTPTVNTNTQFDQATAQMMKLGELRERGLITEEEYEAKRKYYLDLL